MDERSNETGQRRSFAGVRYVGSGVTGRMVFGLVFMTLGALWTLDNLGLVDSEAILQWWPAGLVAFGVAKLTGVGSGRNTFWGTLLVIVGSWWLAENFALVPHISLWHLWPLVLVFIGVSMLVGAGHFTLGTRFRDAASSNTADDAERLSSFAVWASVVRKVVSQQFRGGEASAVMGGIDLDLRGAKPVPEGAVLEVLAIWGGIDVFVPSHWRVINQATVIMGAVEDHTKLPPSDATDTLILRGLVMMGGVEIKN